MQNKVAINIHESTLTDRKDGKSRNDSSMDYDSNRSYTKYVIHYRKFKSQSI